MGILDDAIKEHLELKRQHGADDSELKQLEDEAFGAAERPGGEGSAPDAAAEAPTQFMTQPEVDEESSRPAPRAQIADLQEAPPSTQEESAPEAEAPAEEESPAMEHEAVPEAAAVPEPEPTPEAEISTGPTTEEREAIAEQPTEMYDVEEELASSAPETAAEEELIDDQDEYEEDDDFWDEKRLSDELDQALEAPSEAEDEEEESAVFEPEAEPAPEPEQQPDSDREEDVLEETPDFLEETPEDDQLWFEQKPPKDFDFDD
ncbi:MAG TPA: hypothetical protein VFM94_01965 [Solirubrobacterales bacterium]|nr:hypothetical protein [Solirubrobacterales bacterium]